MSARVSIRLAELGVLHRHGLGHEHFHGFDVSIRLAELGVLHQRLHLHHRRSNIGFPSAWRNWGCCTAGGAWWFDTRQLRFPSAWRNWGCCTSSSRASGSRARGVSIRLAELGVLHRRRLRGESPCRPPCFHPLGGIGGAAPVGGLGACARTPRVSIRLAELGVLHPTGDTAVLVHGDMFPSAWRNWGCCTRDHGPGRRSPRRRFHPLGGIGGAAPLHLRRGD